MKLNTSNFLAAVVGLGMALNGVAAVQFAGAGSLAQKPRVTSGSGHSGAGHSGATRLTTRFNANCAPGFFKAGEKKMNNPPWTNWYVCSTQVLTCPLQPQSNGLYSGIHVQAIVQMVGGDPDSGTSKFRIQYKCDYSWTALPEG